MSRRTASRTRSRPVLATKGRSWIWVIFFSVLVMTVGFSAWWLAPSDPAALRARAESAEASKDWPSALRAWRSLNATKFARGRTWLGEARACLALGLASQAEIALAKASEADPADPEPWRLRLDLLRTEGRTADAVRVGWSAYRAVGPLAKRSILRELTLSLLLDDVFDSLPDDRALARLDRWVLADPDDPNARVAQHRRVAALPRPGDPDLAAWVEMLKSILARDPRQVVAREALVTALADAGEIDRGRTVLDAWPETERDARYQRIKGRWDLDYDRNAGDAAAAFEAALTDLPHDWKTRTLLARAYQVLKRPDDARREATRVAVLHELLDPSTLVPRLAADMSRLDDPQARNDLADLCARAGLDRLADAWRREVSSVSAR